MKRFFLSIALLFVFAASAQAQRWALLHPRVHDSLPGLDSVLRTEVAKRATLVDDDLAAAAFRSVQIADVFNMSADEARRVGSVIGCDRFLLFRSASQRRIASGGRTYFEAYVVTYLVETRSGTLIDWRLTTSEAATREEAAAQLRKKMEGLAASIVAAKGRAGAHPAFPEPPPESSSEAAGLKLPVPYRRIRPQYTETAFLYGVEATVDIEVDIDADGSVGRSRIARWAGFGLDESVEAAVRSMNWRPAMRDERPLPMRVLLRYNFRKVEKDEEN